MTSHPWRLASVFAVCLSIALAAAGWLTMLVFRLDEGQLEARHSADVEGRVRLALWRIDSAIAPLVAQENARPYFVLEPFYSLDAAASFDPASSASLVPSPLLADAGHGILLHFQVRNDGTLTSPQVPTGPLRELAAERYVSSASLRAAESRLRELATWLQVRPLLAELPAGESGTPSAAGSALVVKMAPSKATARAGSGTEYRRRLLVFGQNMASQQLLQTQLNPRSLGSRSADPSAPTNPLAPSDLTLGVPGVGPFGGGNLLDTLSFSPAFGSNQAETSQLLMACTRPLDIVGDPGSLGSDIAGNEPPLPNLAFGGSVANPWTANLSDDSPALSMNKHDWILACSLPPPDRSALVSIPESFTSALVRSGGVLVPNPNAGVLFNYAGVDPVTASAVGNPGILFTGGGLTVVSTNTAPTTTANVTANGTTNLVISGGNIIVSNGTLLNLNSELPNALAWNVNSNGIPTTNDANVTFNSLTINNNANLDGNTTITGNNTYTGTTVVNSGAMLQNSGHNDSQVQTSNWTQGTLNIASNTRPAQQRAVPSVAMNRFTNVLPATQSREQGAKQVENPAGSKAGEAAPTQTIVTTGMMTPVWIGDHLLLARRVSTGSSEYLQGCWLDWQAIQADLKGLAEDLLPGLELEPVRASGGAERERMLATLPVRLLPGTLPVAEVAHSPLRLSLVPAWIGIVLAAIASAVLLGGILALSERRAAFVSAVTHEMRTPLTTFRMYAEMLAEGMVPDDARRKEYLDTLRGEADRLAHLVENVLAYARLERTGVRARGEQLTLAALIDRATGRLRTRSTQAGLELNVELGLAAAGARLWIDASAVEQILFNLVDNACKYAQSASDRRLLLAAGIDAGKARITLRDYGAGIERSQTRQLFRPFSKTDREAAQTAPGVGLGLALSRRLARTMGGDLALVPCDGPGAAFVLTLPLEVPRSPSTAA